MPEPQSDRIERHHVQRLRAPRSAVFPLLCPVREYEWIEPWRCDLLYSRSGVAELDCVFTTGVSGEPSFDVWVVTDYEPNRVIEFVRTNSRRVMRYRIELEDGDDGSTIARNTQVITALRGGGLEASTSAAFEQEMRVGEAMLNHYLSTGRRLPLADAFAMITER